ncbi:MAG: hypothetical protein ACYSUM_07165 [Planctomycetota bacterium]
MQRLRIWSRSTATLGLLSWLVASAACSTPRATEGALLGPAPDIVICDEAYALSRALANLLERTPSEPSPRAKPFWQNDIGILVDGTDGNGSFWDHTFRSETGATKIPVGELTAYRPGGVGWVVAFTKGLCPTRVRVKWTPQRDVRHAPFGQGADPLIRGRTDGPLGTVLKLTVWVCTPRVSRWEVVDALITTNVILWKERVGLFVHLDIKDAVAQGIAARPDGEDFLRYPRDDLMLNETIGKDADRINVYYVDEVFDEVESEYLPTSGLTEAIGLGEKIIVLGHNASDDLLSHELGHCLSLHHVEPDGETFGIRNVMYAKTTGRSYLAEGQTFRCHYDKKSALNIVYGKGPPAGQLLSTAPGWENVKIPARHRRAWRDGSLSQNQGPYVED